MSCDQWCEEHSYSDGGFTAVQDASDDHEIPTWFQSWISEDDAESVDEKSEVSTCDPHIQSTRDHGNDDGGTTESKRLSGIDEESEDGSVVSEDEERPCRRHGESVDGYEMRSQYWKAMSVLNRDMARAADEPGYVYDCMELPPSGLPKTDAMKQLSKYPIKRAWKRRRFQVVGSDIVETVKPDVRSAAQVEAVMIYERGEVQGNNEQCSRCANGYGVTGTCVSIPTSKNIPDIGNGACSNCIFSGSGAICSRMGGLADHKAQAFKLDGERSNLHREKLLGQAKLVEAAAQHFMNVMHQWTATLEREKQQKH